MSELRPDLEELIQAARSGHDPSGLDYERVRATLMKSISSAATGASLTSGAATSLLTVKGKLFLAVALLAGTSALYPLARDALSSATPASIPNVQPEQSAPSLAEGAPVAPTDPERPAPKPHLGSTPAGTVISAIDGESAPISAHAGSAPTAPLGAPRASLATKSRGNNAAARLLARTSAAPTSTNDGSSQRSEPTEATEAPPSGPSVGEAEAQTPAAEAQTPPGVAPASGELALLRGTLVALRDRDPARALSLLERHARDYPHGTMQVERQGLRVVALCDLGEVDQGRTARTQFLARHGNTPVGERVRSACGGQ
jgi:hypothetical protein